eukprot:TRINITY_DN32843_c0_g1_i1.p1 TRINITY_DN32843_c0_g1~~TRINITY_DN32843_c0_g1_i1.p1  ORF type:complete len:304 (+),score=54.92 TRINITY_DN32843_c0_g1_i1:72-983(+)
MADPSPDEVANLKYIRENKVHQLFENLADVLLKAKPKQPIPFLIPVLVSMAESQGLSVEAPKIGEEPKKYDPTQEDRSEVPAGGAATRQRMKVTLAVFGLDNAGKSTLISALGGKIDTETKPTLGFSPTRLTGEQFDIVIYDLGGGRKLRAIWPQYYADVHGVVFVVDAADPDRFAESLACLQPILSDERSSSKPLLLLGNKQDSPGAATADDLRRAFNVSSLECPCRVDVCCALREEDPTHTNIERGMEWLLEFIASQYEALTARIRTQVKAEKERRKREFEEQRARVERNKQLERAAKGES